MSDRLDDIKAHAADYSSVRPDLGDIEWLIAEVERLRARPYWNGTDAMSPGWEAAVAQVEQLRAAVRAVRRLPQRPWSEAEADGIEALQARAYNSGLNDARHAIDAALEGEL